MREVGTRRGGPRSDRDQAQADLAETVADWGRRPGDLDEAIETIAYREATGRS